MTQVERRLFGLQWAAKTAITSSKADDNVHLQEAALDAVKRALSLHRSLETAARSKTAPSDLLAGNDPLDVTPLQLGLTHRAIELLAVRGRRDDVVLSSADDALALCQTALAEEHEDGLAMLRNGISDDLYRWCLSSPRLDAEP